MNYAKSRETAFEAIRTRFGNAKISEGARSLIANGDSLSLLKSIPDQSISLILTDPPYHSTKKRNIFGDTAFSADEEYIRWMASYAAEWRRVLRPNGSLYLFCASDMAAQLEVMMKPAYNILSHIVWTKPNEPGFDGWKQKMNKNALRQFYGHSERILFLEPAVEGNLFRAHFANVLREYREKSGLTQHKLTEITGAFGKVNHGGAVSNWEAGRNTPSREQYQKICAAFSGAGVKGMPPYEDLIRPFEMDGTREFTDVWTFPNVRPYAGKHPAEKPLALLEHAISAASYKDDIVLDCFAGSGSTAIAALRLGRHSISIEIDPQLADRMVDTVGLVDAQRRLRTPLVGSLTKRKKTVKDRPQLEFQLPAE